MNDTSENSQSLTNPWISDRCLGTFRNVQQLARTTGHLSKISILDQEENTQEAYECAPSLRMITALRAVKHNRQQLEKVNFDIQRHLQDKETRDITHGDILEQRIANINELNSHLEEVIKNKQLLISRLQQPFVNDHLQLKLQYQRYAGELLPRLIPTLSELSAQLDNLEWAVRLESTVGDLGGLLADVTSTLGSDQLVTQNLVQVRAMMQQLYEHRLQL